MFNQLKNLALVLYKFNTQKNVRKNYINIAKIIQQQQSTPNIKSNVSQRSSYKTNQPFISDDQNNILNSLSQNPWSQTQSSQSGYSHMSSQQQIMNHKIKTAIRSQSIYHQCTKNKHKLQMRHYALMFCKILELRKSNSNERKQTQNFTNFLSIVEKNLQKMPPEELVRIIYSIKYEGVTKKDLKLLMPIIQKIVNQFSDSQNSQLEPKSYETLKLSTSIKLFHSFLFLLQQTGSHYQQKIKRIMNQTLTYILFRSMKTKKVSKSGQYFPIGLKMSFLHSCKDINATNACIKNLMLSVLVQKQKIFLQNLLDVQSTIFQSPQVLQKTRKQLFTEKDIHIKYNILYRVQKYIQDQIPLNLKKPQNYSFLTKKLVKHLLYMSELTFDQLKILDISSTKDEQIFKILSLFHQAYKNYLIENYISINERQEAVKFFNKNQNIDYTLYELLMYFYLKLKKDGVNAVRPSTKKQLKEFVSLLCKFFGKLNFLTQSAIVQILILSNFANLRPILTEYFQINTLVTTSRRVQKPHFFTRDKHTMMNTFFQMIKYETIFRQNCPVQYEVFMSTNLKNIVKFIFKDTHQLNIQKLSFYLAAYCKPLNQQNLKGFIDSVLKSYLHNSWLNRSFKKQDVDIIYNNQDYFLTSDLKPQPIQLQNQTDIFGENVLKKQQKQLHQMQKILSTLQNDKQYMREHYELQQAIRYKLRSLFKNFKFVILFLENIKLILPQSSFETFINQELYVDLLSNFKTQLQCLKFQRFLTKQNCSQITEINDFLKNIWEKTINTVEIRNEFLMHKHEITRQKQNKSIKAQADKNNQINENQALSVEKQQEVKQQNEKEIQIKIQDEDQQQSEDGEYIQQIQYLKGKDMLSLQTVKIFKQKLSKSYDFFKSKNKQCLNEISNITNNFTQISKDMINRQQKINLLKDLVQYYSQSSNNQQNKINVVDLASFDYNKLLNQNLSEVLSLHIQNKQNKVIYNFKVFTKLYPSFYSINLANNIKQSNQNSILKTIYYVNSSKLRRNKKKLQEINQINQKQSNTSTQNIQTQTSQNKQ